MINNHPQPQEDFIHEWTRITTQPNIRIFATEKHGYNEQLSINNDQCPTTPRNIKIQKRNDKIIQFHKIILSVYD